MVSSHARKDGLYDVPLAGDVTASPEESLLAADANVFHLAAGESLAMARRKKRNLKSPVFVYDKNFVSAKSLALKRKIEGLFLALSRTFQYRRRLRRNPAEANEFYRLEHSWLGESMGVR